jgi:uncharacterized protein (DUF1697 family)
MTTYIALLRGINVGRAKRLAMADLRDLLEGLGYKNARTVLNSGNAIFEANRSTASKLAQSIEAGIERRFGFTAATIVLTAAELAAIVRKNPLADAANDPSQYLVAFASSKAALAKAKPLLAESWTPEALAIGSAAAYVWCSKGILASKLLPEFGRLTGDGVTTRNWSTVLKILAASCQR